MSGLESSQDETASWNSRWVGRSIGQDHYGRAVYDCVELEPFDDADDPIKVCLGDTVEVFPDDAEVAKLPELPDGSERVYVVKVTKLWEKLQGKASGTPAVKYFEGEWFYTIWDTIVLTEVGGKAFLPPEGNGIERLDSRQVFKADQNEGLWGNKFEVGVIKRVVRIVHVTPGHPAPNPGSCDYWWSMMYSKRFYTFRDYDHKPAAARSNRVLKSIDIFSGCGGFSFVAQRNENGRVEVGHAVDIFEDSLRTFQVNHPNTHVHLMHVEEFIFACQKLHQLYDTLDDRDVGNDTVEQGFISGVRVDHPEDDRWDSSKPEVQLPEEVSEDNSWLVFEYNRPSVGAAMDRCWLRQDSIPAGAFSAFLRAARERGTFPCPATTAAGSKDVDFICGGPPCQGLSGLNKSARTKDILEDSRNSQIKAFLKAVMVFKPAFVLLENIQASISKQREDGLYIKFAIVQLLSMGYQTRLGLIASDDQGVPEHRRRCFLWAAKSGSEALPPFPKPVCHSEKWDWGEVPHLQDFAVSIFEDDKGAGKGGELFPPLVTEDALDDLPEVSNFSFTDAMQYKSEPTRPYQLWMRRSPPDWEPSFLDRAAQADMYMHASRQSLFSALTRTAKLKRKDRLNALGQLAMGMSKPEKFEKHVVKLAVADATPGARQMFDLWARHFRASQVLRFGKMVEVELERYEEAAAASQPGPLRDHVPSTCRSIIYDRMLAVPKASPVLDGPDYRDMRGIVEHKDGSCCVGHTHPITRGTTSCKGGGNSTLVKAAGGGGLHRKTVWRTVAGREGAQLKGCPASTVFAGPSQFLVPRRFVKRGTKNCPYGRVELQGSMKVLTCTVQPETTETLHPRQDRTLTVREHARLQGFPDYYVFVGSYKRRRLGGSLIENVSVSSRFKQIGNSVVPAVAAALGRCLLLAAAGRSDPMEPIAAVLDPEFERVMVEAKAKGLRCRMEEPDVQALVHQRHRASSGSGEDGYVSSPTDPEEEQNVVSESASEDNMET
eukprot:evm.model.scf_49.18 EVM.evm.TU.scf_49.18   scf_49:167968-179229(+)